MRWCPRCGEQHDDTAVLCGDDGPTQGGNGGPSAGTVLGSYRLIERLGKGGMGWVYVAEHTRLGRRVALKLLRPEHAANPNAVRRFFGEARAVNTINHEHIIDITDFVEGEGAESYCIMELLEGVTLRQLIEREGRLPLPRLAGIASQVCDALAAVHAVGMVHRDLKPDNIFLTTRAGQSDFVKVMDFGVVKLSDWSHTTSVADTAAGAILGTPEYMAPEQVGGKAVDPRTDIYALGVILYEMATGEKPFHADTFGEMVVQHLTVKPKKPNVLIPDADALPSAIEALILACLAKDPARRPQNASEVARAIQPFADKGQTSVASVQSTWPPRRRGSRRVLAASTGLAALAAVGIIVAFANRGGSTGGPQRAAMAAGAQHDAAVDIDPWQPAQSVAIAFDSEPRGAVVQDVGAGSQLGVTPFTISLPVSTTHSTFRFSLSGYQTLERQLIPREDGKILVHLTKRPMPARKRRKRERLAPRSRRATLDPFADP